MLQEKEAQIAELQNRLFVATDQLIRLRGFLTQHASAVTKEHRQLDTDYETTDEGGTEEAPAPVVVPLEFDEDVRIPMDTAPSLCECSSFCWLDKRALFLLLLKPS